jgi:hypothetical protein
MPAARSLIPSLWSLLALAILGAVSLAPAGCNIVAPALMIAQGPPKIEAQLKLDKSRTHVILIDDRRSVLPSRNLRELIGTTAEKALLEKDAVTDIVQSRIASAQVRGERFGTPMSIVEVARAVKADVIIYATVDSFSLTVDGQSLAPTAVLRVKVIDAQTEQRLLPPDGELDWRTLTVSLPSAAATAPTSQSQVFAIQTDLAHWTGIQLARMFYDVERALASPGARVRDIRQ